MNDNTAYMINIPISVQVSYAALRGIYFNSIMVISYTLRCYDYTYIWHVIIISLRGMISSCSKSSSCDNMILNVMGRFK